MHQNLLLKRLEDIELLLSVILKQINFYYYYIIIIIIVMIRLPPSISFKYSTVVLAEFLASQQGNVQ